MEDSLDRAVWTALATRQSAFALGGPQAKRFVSDVAPFAAARDASPESLVALSSLLEDGETGVYLLQRAEISLPETLTAPMVAPGVQMIRRRTGPVPIAADEIIRLTREDISEMHALAELTKPGPFRARTFELGDYFGIKIDGRLAAMAGERLKVPGFTEISAVCTHPDFRGRGFGAALTAFLADRIERKGEIPFLHTYAGNQGAIRLYQRLGFERRCSVHVAILEKPIVTAERGPT